MEGCEDPGQWVQVGGAGFGQSRGLEVAAQQQCHATACGVRAFCQPSVLGQLNLIPVAVQRGSKCGLCFFFSQILCSRAISGHVIDTCELLVLFFYSVCVTLQLLLFYLVEK